MAGSSMTFTVDAGQATYAPGARGHFRRLIVNWTSDSATGAVTGTTANANGSPMRFVGRIIRAITYNGAAAPTTGYSITLTDANGLNILGKCQSTLSTVASNGSGLSPVQTYFFLQDATGTPVTQASLPIIFDTITIAVAGAGNSKNGVLILTIEE
jgi:hypothetical protein